MCSKHKHYNIYILATLANFIVELRSRILIQRIVRGILRLRPVTGAAGDKRRLERVWQKFAQRGAQHSARRRLCHVHAQIGLGKLGQRLAAHAARCSELVLLVGDHRNGGEIALAHANRVRNGRPFGADRRAERGVLHIAAGNDSTGGQPQGGTNGELAIRTVGIVTRCYGGLNQLLCVRVCMM